LLAFPFEVIVEAAHFMLLSVEGGASNVMV